jgi:hypothetical protein
MHHFENAGPVSGGFPLAGGSMMPRGQTIAHRPSRVHFDASIMMLFIKPHSSQGESSGGVS